MNHWYRMNNDDACTFIMQTLFGTWLRHTDSNSSTSIFIHGATLKDFGFTVDLIEEEK
jgi:hypothetical protein